jgi:hypothetical protein
MWLLDSRKASQEEVLHFEFRKPKQEVSGVNEKKGKKITSPRVLEGAPIESPHDSMESLSKVVQLQGALTHPYFRELWRILKMKKQDLRVHSEFKGSYQISFLLKKIGNIENINVRGRSSEVALQIKEILTEDSETPSIPDEVSNSDIQIHYEVDI